MPIHFKRPTPHVLALLVFLALFFILVQDVRHWGARDPTSVFFKPEIAFDRKYSLVREQQAEDFVNLATTTYNPEYVKASSDPSMCVGIATVQRDGARYFKRAVGSILDGLTEPERRDIYLISFIANVDPSIHSAWNETWLRLLSDNVATYDDAREEVVAQVKELERTDPKFDRKPLFDYTYLLRACHDMGAPYVVMLEDDVIAADGWYLRTKAGIEALEGQKDFGETVYLRLFYNERILGWNSEEWFTYLVNSILVEIAVLAALLLALKFVPYAPMVLTPATIGTISILIVPISIGLFFAAGRLTVSPPPRGLHRMDTYGCCSQAFVIPRERVPELIMYYERQGQGKLDALTENFANEKGLKRWAITPSVFAHVGSTSSKSSFISRWGRSNTENIWNFSFEEFDAEELKDEHL